MNKFLTIATVAAGLLFATAAPSEARDRHHHGGGNRSHHSHYSGGRHDGHHHHHYYSGYRGSRSPYYYGYRPAYRPRYYGGYYPRETVTIFVPGIGYVVRSY